MLLHVRGTRQRPGRKSNTRCARHLKLSCKDERVVGTVITIMEEQRGIETSENVRFISVETTDDANYEPKEAKDRGITIKRHAFYFLGDCAVFLLFIRIGRSGHGMSLGFGDILTSALPFITGWIIAGYILGAEGAFGEATQDSRVPLKNFFRAHVKSVLLGVPLGSVLFSLEREHVHLAMWLITFLFSSVLLTVWRLLAFFCLLKLVDGSK